MSIPPADYAAPPSTGKGTPAKNSSQKRKRKRSSTRYQVGHTTSAYKILPKHQQPPEQPLIPPIKLRRVYDDHRRVVSSFGEQSTQEPMETEPAITAHTGSLPIAVTGPPSENPQPTSGNTLPATSETTPAAVRENIELIEEDDLTEIPPEVLSMFLPEHQAALQEHLINENLETNQPLKMVVQNAERLLKTLRERKIELSKNRSKPPFYTLFARLKAFSIIEKPELFSTYFAKATVFFSAVNTTQIKNTGCLSSMLQTKSQIKGFAEQSEEDIRAIVGQPFLKQISSMRNGKGFPTRAQVGVFIAIPCLKQGWQQGKDEAVQGNPVDQGLLIHISSMHNGRGFPTREQVEAFMTMPCLKKGWKQGSDEAVQDNLIDCELLMRIASMNSCKGFPSMEQVADFMTMPCLKEGWQQGNDEAVQDNPVDGKLLMRIASMNNRKGFPTSAQVRAFMTMPCLKEGWQQGGDEAVQGKPIDRELLMRVASLNSKKGLPTKEQVAAFMTMPCLKEDWQQGGDEAVQGKPIDRKLLMRIASMNNGKGFPTKKQVEAFVTIPCLKENWQQGSDEAVQGKSIDRELLMHIASMNNSKGFPRKEQVEAFMTMPCLKEDWQQDSDEAVQDSSVDRELLIHIASMNNGKGFPSREQVAAFMTMPCLKEGWQQGSDEAVQGKPIDRGLLIHISSMHNGIGFPTREQVEAFMTMPCLKEDWQQGGDEAVQGKPIDRKLLMRIASMNNGKGFPTKKQVEAFVTIPCLKENWQQGSDEAVQGKSIDRELLMHIASMNNSKGFPRKEQVEAFMTMPCLKEDWQQDSDEAVQDSSVDRELLIHIASMNNGKGFPSRKQVEAFMTMPCLKEGWQQGSDEAVQGKPIDRGLLIHISSMHNGIGFPTREQVEAFMTMPCLKQDWQQCNDEAVQDKTIDRELLMRIASMNNGKGFPMKEQVETLMTMACLKEGWQQGNDEAVQGKLIDRKLLMRIASMNCGKGFPPREQVEAFMTMPCLKQGWKQGSDEAVQNEPIDLKLLMRIASMSHGKGFPTRAQVSAFMTMPCLKEGWKQGSSEAVQGDPIDRELLMHVASMNSGKGFPTGADVAAFVQWLPQDSKKHCLMMACRMFHSSGLPEQRVLTVSERALRQYLPDLPAYSTGSDDDISESDDEPGDERVEADQMKVLALFCAAPGQWHMKIADFEQFLTAFTNARNERAQVLSALASLMPMLFNHGGAGVRFWLARHNENQHNSHLLTRALSIPARLDTVKFALTQLPEYDCLEYIELCRNLSPAPNKAQWDALKPLREQLGQRFTMAQSKALMLKILWSQSEAKRSVYGEQLDSFFETVPTIRQLYRIHRAFGPQKMQGFLDACIARQTGNANALIVKAQELLLEGLLLAHHYLSDHGQIPDLCFSSQVASTNGKGVIINGDAAMPGQKRLWHFIAAMLIELEQTPEYQFEKQRLTVLSGSGPVVLPKPEFSLAGSGFEITNWSLEQVRGFFQATEFTERWYKHPQDERELYMIRRDDRLANSRANETENAGNKKATSPLAPSVILSVIKSGLTLKPVIWASLEHYAKNGQLTAGLCQALAPVIQQQEAVAPDIVKIAVTVKLAEINAQTNRETDAGEATITQPSPVISELIPPPPVAVSQATLETAMAALDRFEVLGETELEMLQPFRDQMAPGQLASVVDKMRHSVDVVTQLNWRTTYEKKIKDLLGLDELISWSGYDQSDWLADIL